MTIVKDCDALTADGGGSRSSRSSSRSRSSGKREGSVIAEASVLGHLTVITAAFREKRVWSEKKNGSTGTGNGTVTQVPTKPAEHPKKNEQKERERRGREAEGKRER